MKIIVTRHLNLHTKSVDGGLVHVPAKQARLVPDDVADHPLFKKLVSSGTVVLLKGKKAPDATPVKQNVLPEENPITTEDENSDDDKIVTDETSDLEEIIADDEEESDNENEEEN